MIAELFYPRELKDIIAELRANDDLNEAALKTLNRPVDYCIFPIWILILFVLSHSIYNPTFGIETPLFSFVFLIAYTPFYMDGIWRTYHASYILGDKTGGTVKNITFAVAGGTRIDVVNSTTGVEHRVCTTSPVKFKIPVYLPQVGETVSYFLAEEKQYQPTPNIYEYMKKHCLKKSMIKGE